MNTNFVFPRHQPTALRPRPAQAAKSSPSSPDLAGSRDSNALRASILDIALELGVGSSPLVTDWMFNNVLEEEPEDEVELISSPVLTYGSPTSVESPLSSLLHFQNRCDSILNANGNGDNSNLSQDVNTLKPLQGDAGTVEISDVDSQYFNANASNDQTISVIDSSIVSSRSRTPPAKKLRKKYPGRDGYESSDGGYLSEKKGRQKEAPRDGVDIKQRKKKKFFTQVMNKISNDPLTKGYDTDEGSVLSSTQTKRSQTKKSKTKDPPKEIGYETDGGYPSGNKKSKTRFFRLTTKPSKVDLRVAAISSVPALPNFAEKTSELVVPLPIAGRFAATLSRPATEGGECQGKLQKARALFSSSMQGHQQQHGLRTASSLSSLQDPNSATSTTAANLPLTSQSLSASPTSPVSLATSFPSVQVKKPVRLQIHSNDPTQQNSPSRCVPEPLVLSPPPIPLKNPSRPTKVRPRNPPTDGFGPRSPLRSDFSPASTHGSNPILHSVPSRGLTPPFISNSNGLSHKSCPQESVERSSQVTIIPSSGDAVPSTQISSLKTRPPPVSTYHHHNHLPPQSNPAPMAPLPSPPSSKSLARFSSSKSASQLPSAAQLRQRMSKINKRQSAQQTYGIGSSGEDLFLPPRRSVASTMTTRSVSVGGVGLRRYPEPYALEKGVDDIHGRGRRIDKDEDVKDESDKMGVEDPEADPDEFGEILDRFKNCDDENGDVPDLSSGGQALERSQSFKAGKLAKEKQRSFPTELCQQNKMPAHDVSGFEDDGKTMGDRTSRWSGSLYSRASSIEDEDGSEERTDRFMRRVEAMLDSKRIRSHVPSPRIAHPYANPIHSPTGYI